MGGGRDKNGVPIYYRRNGTYIRKDGTPVNHRVDKWSKSKLDATADKERFINSEVERVREFLTLMDAMDEFNEKEIRASAEKAWKKQNNLLSFQEKVESAHTKDEMLNVLLEKYGENNVTEDFINNIDLQTVKRIVTAIDKLEEQYPFMKGKITRLSEHSEVLGYDEYDIDTMASMSPYGELSISKNHLNDLFSGSERGFHPPNMTPESAVAHEFGHMMLNYYIDLNMDNLDLTMDNPEIFNLRPITDLVIKSLPVKFRRGNGSATARQISEYASYSYKEAFAEAMADIYANGKNASPVSAAYVNTLVNQIKEAL